MKLLQIHIPKTGGTSVRKALRGEAEYFSHLRLQDPQMVKALAQGDTFTFTFLRDPLDRAVSLYAFFVRARASRFHKFEALGRNKGRKSLMFQCGGLKINEFWREVLADKADFEKAPYFQPQHRWFTHSNEADVNYYDFGALESEFERLCSDAGVVGQTLQHARKGDRKAVAEELEDDVIELIRNYYAEDYAFLKSKGVKTYS